jgi:hypothetical protein
VHIKAACELVQFGTAIGTLVKFVAGTGRVPSVSFENQSSGQQQFRLIFNSNVQWKSRPFKFPLKIKPIMLVQFFSKFKNNVETIQGVVSYPSSPI